MLPNLILYPFDRKVCIAGPGESDNNIIAVTVMQVTDNNNCNIIAQVHRCQ